MKFKYKFKLANIISKLQFNFYKNNNNVILLYHSVINNNSIGNFSRIDNLTKTKFSQQCNYLKKNFKNRITKVSENISKKGSISISFDDGKKNIITNVFPIIQKYEIPITIFICPELVGKKNYLNLEDIKFLKLSGLVEIGAHGYRHIPYKNQNNGEFLNEISLMKKWFINNLNEEILYFSFPFGSFNKNIIKLIKKEKLFRYSFCSDFRTFKLNDLDYHIIPRIQIWEYDNLSSFNDKIKGNWNWARKLISYG